MLKEPHTPVFGLPRIDADEVDRKLADGWTLPATLYTDPAVLELEDKAILRSAWQVVATLADFRDPGDFLTANLGKYPVLVVKGKDGELRAFMNVCRHRAALVASGDGGDQVENVSGNCSRFKCPYHGWVYDLDGRLLGAPNWKQGNLGDFAELGLRPVSIGTWAGVVFVSIEPTEPLESFLSDVPALANEKGYQYPFLEGGLQFAGAFEWNADANWKMFQEIMLECYHCGVIHADSLGAVMNVDVNEVCIIDYKNGNHLSGPFAGDVAKHIGVEAAARLQKKVDESHEPPFSQFWLWPNTIISHGVGWGVGIYRIDPIDANHCRMIARIYSEPDDEDTQRVLEMLPDVIAEDIAVCGGVQAGLRSGAREWGPMLAHGAETTLSKFANQVWEHLAPSFRAA